MANETEIETGTETQDKQWWEAALNRRDTTKLGIGVAAVAALSGCGDGSKVEELDTIEAQKKGGWDVGDTGLPLLFLTGVKSSDSKGGTGWKTYTAPAPLLAAVKPKQPEWEKRQMPTLIQSLDQQTLAAKMKPVASFTSDENYRQAKALGALVSTTETPADTLLILDLPTASGPAAAAGMAEFVEPVFMYDNWPHPKGVVKSHETLGSLVYYAKELEEKKAKRGEKVPTAIILDSTRINMGKNPGANDFDNRYFVDLPAAEDLKKMGVKNVMYVTQREQKDETDDLNDSFADYKDAGIKVTSVPLSNFRKDPTVTDVANDPTGGYYYGGQRRHHTYFYSHYPMFIWVPVGRYGWGSSISRTAPRSVRAPSYAPTRRPTAFSSRKMGGAAGVGRTKPSGFGRVSTRMSKSGRVLGTKSGSVGRFRSSSSFGG